MRLTDVGLPRLRALLEALAVLAPKVEYPAVPEMRITCGDQQYLVQVREGHMRFSSWSLRAGGCDLTPAQILAAITGTDEVAEVPVVAAAATGEGHPRRRGWLVAVLAAGILGSNALTAWWLTSPATNLPREVFPEYRLLEPEPAQRLLDRVAGTYETGREEGDRRLFLRRDGTVLWGKYGARLAMVEETELTAAGAESGGQPALLASNRMLIAVKDAATLVYFGDTYRRVQP